MNEISEKTKSGETNFTYSEFAFDSTVAGQKIFTRSYLPRDEVRAVVQIIHGMAEHGALYEEFCRRLAEQGYAVVVDDHLGHGRSVASGEDFGYFFEGGINNLILDEKKLHDLTAKKFPTVPYFLLGHSMGSFITREYIARYGEELSGAVIMGTAGGMKLHMWLAQKALLDLLIAKNGPRCKMKKISKLATKEYVKAFPDSENDWVTSDPAEVERYTKDPMCGFELTLSAYRSIGELIQTINSAQWYRRVPKELPLLLVSGEKDPVGGMGIGVRKVAASLVKTEHDAELILYPNMRHALVTEIGKEQVFRDIETFLEYKTIRARRGKKENTGAGK